MTSCDRDGVVTFRFYRPNVSLVSVLGTFNGWCGDSLPMASAGDGWWSLEAELPAGDYRFRFFADGEWFTDFAANGVENAKFGWNSVLIIPEQQPAITLRERLEWRREPESIGVAA